MHKFGQKQKTTQQIISTKDTNKSNPFCGQNNNSHFLLQLQRTFGNQGVQRLLQNNNNIPEVGAPNSVPDCNTYDLSLMSQDNRTPPGRVGQSGDKWEQEADRAAEAVLSGRNAGGISAEGFSGPAITPIGSQTIQLSEYTAQDHASSVPHLMRILDQGDVNNISAALSGLWRADRLRSDSAETANVVFSTSPSGNMHQEDTYNLIILSNEIDEFIRMYVRYLSQVEHADQETRVSESFVTDFNDRFRNILHIFRPIRSDISLTNTSLEEASYTGERDSSAQETSANQELSAQEIASYFTQGQIALLSQYFERGIIPERLFNGDENNRLDAGLRIVMSAHILANGRYNPGDRMQRVHARMCFHWAHLVHHYAGVTPPQGPLTTGTMGTTDPTGQIVLGGGSQADQNSGIESIASDRQAARAQRLQEAQANLDEVRRPYDAANTNVQRARQERADALNALNAANRATEAERGAARGRMTEANQRLRAATEELQTASIPFNRANQQHRNLQRIANQSFVRRSAIPLSDIMGLQRGDWLFIHNDNDSRSGDHSVIFSRWISWVQLDPNRGYGQVELFSQGSPAGGGVAHTEWLGNFNGIDNGHRIRAVTWFRRSSPDSNPADSTDEILPPLSSTTGTVNTNRRFIEQHNVDRSRMMELLSEQNLSLLDSLAWRLTQNQRSLLLSIDEVDNLERRVQLNERLQNLSTNVTISETARASSVETCRSRYEPQIARRRQTARDLLSHLAGRFDTVTRRLGAFESAIMSRPEGVVPIQRRDGTNLHITFDADTFAEEIGLTEAVNATSALNTLLQNETVTHEEAEEEALQIDQLERLFLDLSAHVPEIRPHLRNLLRSTYDRNNRVTPAVLGDFRRWGTDCRTEHQPLDLAIQQLNQRIRTFAGDLSRQGGALPFVTTHIGAIGDRSTPTGELSHVQPDIIHNSRSVQGL